MLDLSSKAQLQETVALGSVLERVLTTHSFQSAKHHLLLIPRMPLNNLNFFLSHFCSFLHYHGKIATEQTWGLILALLPPIIFPPFNFFRFILAMEKLLQVLMNVINELIVYGFFPILFTLYHETLNYHHWCSVQSNVGSKSTASARIQFNWA